MQYVCLGLFSLLMNQVKILAAKWLRPSKAQHYGLICFYWTKLLRPWFLPVQNDMKHRNPFGDICKSLFRAIAFFICQDNFFYESNLQITVFKYYFHAFFWIYVYYSCNLNQLGSVIFCVVHTVILFSQIKMNSSG